MIFKLKVSFFLVTTVAATHVGALLVVIALALPSGVAVVLALTVVMSAGRTLPVLAQLSRHSVVALRYSSHVGWELCTRSNFGWQAVELMHSLRHPQLVIMGFRSRPAGVRHVPVSWDSLGADEFRRLRAALVAPSIDLPASNQT